MRWEAWLLAFFAIAIVALYGFGAWVMSRAMSGLVGGNTSAMMTEAVEVPMTTYEALDRLRLAALERARIDAIDPTWPTKRVDPTWPVRT